MAKTVKVRIAVAIAPSGSWNSSGYATAGQKRTVDDEAEMMGMASEIWEGDACATGEARYWVEAELAIPEITTVHGAATVAS